ncbi:CPBP family glutamic-type intramembrane protease [Curvibacter sp. HBC61]|uniref:CPBP family glutamic-type intramembrane protease n=1 Tax=Curvibacter cyanobacteriorum TaxID=3026422 RepID=A0ABT5MXM0_9BURK|nr:CPBP family glutamic-type intramembrane protease [Curvibacter sp. HBC61]MDD0838089.1 CPBP family glutamic-type intramembrane protease [Curvibacter sp. HBC61]
MLLTPAVAAWAALSGGFRLALPDLGSAVVALLIAPLLEEWVLRSGLQQGLSQLGSPGTGQGPRYAGGPGLAVAVSTVAFALIHLDEVSWTAWVRCLPWLLPGLVLALVWCWRQRLSDCVAMHAYFNACLALASLL